MRKLTVQKAVADCAEPGVRLLILRPAGSSGSGAPGVLWMHGGGYALGMARMALFSRARALVEKFGAVVVAPEYRLSGKAPYPAALNDCYNALLYMKNNAEALGIRTDQLMVGGESAGGGLTAAVCMYARDTGEVNIAYQMPLYPMLDDRDTETSRDNHAPCWNTRRNHWGWRKYLRGLSADVPVPVYASPARQADYRGLPPAYTFVGDIEPFYAETHAYIRNLKQAGVEASVDTYGDRYPGCFHAFDMLTPWRKVSRQAISRFEERFEYALSHYFAKQS